MPLYRPLIGYHDTFSPPSHAGAQDGRGGSGRSLSEERFEGEAHRPRGEMYLTRTPPSLKGEVQDIGVVFCGAPMIAAQLKENCEKYSSKEATRVSRRLAIGSARNVGRICSGDGRRA